MSLFTTETGAFQRTAILNSKAYLLLEGGLANVEISSFTNYPFDSNYVNLFGSKMHYVDVARAVPCCSCTETRPGLTCGATLSHGWSRTLAVWPRISWEWDDRTNRSYSKGFLITSDTSMNSLTHWIFMTSH